MVVAVLNLAALAGMAILVIVFIVLAVFIAPQRDPRRPGVQQPLSLDDLTDYADE
jgi:hypothetical protein